MLTKTPVLHWPVQWRPSFRGMTPSMASALQATTRYDKDTTHADVLQLHREWADACLTSSTLLAPRRHQYLADGCSGQQGCHAQQPLRTMGGQKQQ
jgi:hypothetical protein